MPTKNNNHTESRACTCTCTVHVGTTYIILPLLNIGSKINLQCVFEYVSYDTACKYILLQKAITKSTVLVRNSFFI